MACIEQKTDFNFLNWHKVVGSYTLSELQANGIPSVCDNINVDEGWNISTLAFLQSISVTAQDISPRSIIMNDDGTKMYMFGGTNNTIYQYTLSTAYNISTAIYDSISLNVNAQDTIGRGIIFGDNGSKLYFVGRNSDNVNEYNVSTPYDLSTAVFLQSLSVATQDARPFDVKFNTTGNRMYILGDTNNTIFQFDLSSAWNVSTSVYNSVSFNVGTQDTVPTGIFFKTDGTRIYMIGSNTDFVYEYDLTIAFDMSSVSLSRSKDISSQTSSPTSVFFKPDGFKMYTCGDITDRIYEYDLTS